MVIKLKLVLVATDKLVATSESGPDENLDSGSKLADFQDNFVARRKYRKHVNARFGQDLAVAAAGASKEKLNFS